MAADGMTFEFDRERQALYICGLLPLHDRVEAQAVLDLASRLIPVLAESREQQPKDYQRDDQRGD